MLIAGSFREYPFYLLLEIFQRRRETGVLEITSSQESGYFYIKNGKVKDGQIGKSKGAAAVKSVAGLNDGSFRFKSLEPTDYARVVWQQALVQHDWQPSNRLRDQSSQTCSDPVNSILHSDSPTTT
jgi:hypothetical protein